MKRNPHILGIIFLISRARMLKAEGFFCGSDSISVSTAFERCERSEIRPSPFKYLLSEDCNGSEKDTILKSAFILIFHFIMSFYDGIRSFAKRSVQERPINKQDVICRTQLVTLMFSHLTVAWSFFSSRAVLLLAITGKVVWSQGSIKLSYVYIFYFELRIWGLIPSRGQIQWVRWSDFTLGTWSRTEDKMDPNQIPNF